MDKYWFVLLTLHCFGMQIEVYVMVLAGMELVGPRARVIGGAIISCFYSAGMVFLSAVALWSKNWRILQAIYAPGLICFLYYW